MKTLYYSVVDAFTSEPFQGNPAAVVLDAGDLPDATMQRIAAEFNLSETVFVWPASDGDRGEAVRLRWFTPQCEVSFCGHATLAAAHAVCESSQAVPAELRVECAAGNLTVRVESSPTTGRRYWLAMPPADLRESQVPIDALLDALGLPHQTEPLGPLFETRDRDLVQLVSNGRHVRIARPQMTELLRLSRAHDIRGICLASTDSGDDEIACISRFFAPAAGIPEDPVTGSVHGPLAAILIGGKRVRPSAPAQWSFVCRQVPASGRVGTVHVRAESRGDELAIEVGGSCVTVMRGALAL